MANIGAPSKLSPETLQQIVSAIEDGNYIEVACQAAGIHVDSYYHWLERAAEDMEAGIPESESAYIAFSEAVKKAHAQAEIELSRKISKSRDRGWQRYAWILERTRQDRYALRSKLDVSSKEPLKIVFESVKEATD